MRTMMDFEGIPHRVIQYMHDCSTMTEVQRWNNGPAQLALVSFQCQQYNSIYISKGVGQRHISQDIHRQLSVCITGNIYGNRPIPERKHGGCRGVVFWPNGRSRPIRTQMFSKAYKVVCKFSTRINVEHIWTMELNKECVNNINNN